MGKNGCPRSGAFQTWVGPILQTHPDLETGTRLILATPLVSKGAYAPLTLQLCIYGVAIYQLVARGS